MAKVSNREDALFNAYLSKYKNAQASTVSEGQSKTQAARQKGAAILNATDKTLPSLGDTYGSTLQNIVSGAKMENSLSSDLLNRNLSLAKAQYDYASDMHTQMTAAKKYADEQAEKARKEAEEAAAKAQKEAERQAAAAAKAAAKASRRRSGRRKGSGKKSSSSAAGSEDAAAALAALDAEETTAGTTTGKGTAKTSAAATASTTKTEDTKQSGKEKRQAWQKAQREQHEEILNKQKQQREKMKRLLTPNVPAGVGKSTGKTYAEQQNAGNTTQKPTASQAVTRAGQPVASSYAAAGQDSSPEVKSAAKKNRTDYKSVQEDTAAALKKLQTDAGYRAELAAPGRKLTTAEINAVNQYSDPLWSVKQYAKGDMSADELNQEARERSSLQSKAQFNGLGQSAQAFTAGLYGAFPFTTKASDKLAETANSIYPDKEIPVLSKTLDETKSYDPLAAFAGNMAGQSMKYKLFNTAVEGTKYADAAQKAGSKLYDAAKNIPVLKDIVQPGFGEAAGRVLADTGADLALDTLPTLTDDLSTYRDQQQAIANGQTVDDALTPGRIAGNTAKNIAGNVAMNALPEIGGAVISGIKNRRAADKMLEQQAKELDEWKNMTSGLYNADDYATPDEPIDFTTAIQNSLDDTARQQRNAAAATRAVQLNAALAEQAAEDRTAYTARQAAQSTDNLPIDAQGAAAYNGTNGGVVDADMGAGVRADVLRDAERGAGVEYEPGSAGTGLFGQDGTAGQSGAARGNGYGVQGDGAKDPAAVAEWAKSITGKDRKSSYTRRIENLYNQMQNGASRESMADEATSIAMGIVKDGDFAEPLDEATTTLRGYFKNTPIRLDEQAAGDILYSSGLRNIQQYNIQNGTNFSLTNGVPYDTAMMELSDMGAGVSGSSVDDLLQAVSDSNRKPILDTDLAAAHVDYYRDAILNGTYVRSTDFDTWLRGQPNDETTPDYIRNLMERPDFKEPPVDYDLLSLEDNYQQFEPAAQADGSELNGLFLNENAPLTSDTGYSYAADHLQDAMNLNSTGSVAQDSPYYNDWMQNQGALRQQQAAGGLLADDADAMEAAANRMDSLSRRSEELLGQDAAYRQQQEKAAARQARLDAIQQEYERAANQVPTLESLTDSTEDWKTQPGLMLENGDWLNAYTAPAARQTAESVQTAAPQARPLNGSESVPANAVGAESTQFDRREVVNKDYANQRVMQGDMDAKTAAELGIGQQTHTVYSRAEGKTTAQQDFDVLVQQTGSVTDAGKTVANELNQKVQDGKWDTEDVYKGYYTAEQLQRQLKDLPEGSAEAQIIQAQISNLNRAVSAGNSKAGQTLGAGRWAQPDEYTALRKLDQAVQTRIDKFANTAQGKQLHEFAETVADDFSGTMDDEFTAFVRSQGINTGDEIGDQLEYLAGQIRRAAQSRNVNISEDQAKAAAANLKAGGTVEDIFGEFARKSLGIENLSQEDFDYVVDAFHKIKEMPDSKERYNLETRVYERMAKYMPAKTWEDKFNNIRYFAMLGNTRTHMNNIMGNVTMKAAVVAKDNVAGLMQLALPKEQRTKAIGTTLTADGRKMVSEAKKYAETDFYSVLKEDGKWNVARGLDAAVPAFGGNPNAKGIGKVTNAIGDAFQKLVDVNGKALDAEDYFFLKSTFANSMASDLKAKGYTSDIFAKTDAHSKKVLQEAAARAFADAQEATFHTASPTAQWLNTAPDAVKAVVEGVLPFKKTPINIARASIEYSPVGFLATAKKAHKGAAATEVIDQAAKAITGTAVMAGGYLLAKSGLLHGSSGDDDRAANYDKMTGTQDYSVELPKEIGGGTYTLDWMSPMAAPLLVGAEFANLDNGEKYSVGRIVDAFAHITEPVFDTTMLQSLNSGLQAVKYAPTGQETTYFAENAMGSLAQQFVPTLSGQIARTLDPVRRDNYGGGKSKTERDLNYNLTKMGNKIPWVREQDGSAELPVLGMTATKSSEPYIDLWGRETNNFDWATGDNALSTLGRGAYTILSPGYASKENVTPVDEYLQGLYGDTNNSKVYPEKASSKITVGSEDYYMTPEEKTEYAKTSGQTAYDIVDSLRQNDMFLQLPEDQQAELVQNAYSVAKTVGGVAAVGDGVSGTGAKEYEAYQNGGTEGVVNYMLAKNATDLARNNLRESTGNSNKNLTDLQTWEAIHSEMGDDGIEQFLSMVDTEGDDSALVSRVNDAVGEKAAAAYMNAYSAAVAKAETDENGKAKTPSKYDVGVTMMKQGLSADDMAKAYVAAYGKTDKSGASIYQSYGADGLQGWVRYKAAADLDGNGKISKDDEAIPTLNAMNISNELRRAYLAATNKRWSNPY